MQVRVNLFARFKDLAGKDHLMLSLPDGATIGTVRKSLMNSFAGAVGLLERSALAIDNEIADDGMSIRAGIEIALLPPVSGG
jgi:molybdopterin converting factor small subunit